jgi:hypothetical protein
MLFRVRRSHPRSAERVGLFVTQSIECRLALRSSVVSKDKTPSRKKGRTSGAAELFLQERLDSKRHDRGASKAEFRS